MTGTSDVPELRAHVARTVTTIERDSLTARVLWCVTVAAILVAGIYALWGPDPIEHAEAVSRLWPILLIWTLGLILYTSMANEARKEVIRADTILTTAERNIASKAGQGVGRGPGEVQAGM